MKLPVRYMLTAAAVASITFAVSAGVMIYFWLGAVWGVAIFAGTMAPIIGHAVLGGFFLDPSKTKDAFVDRDSPPLRERIRGMTVPLVTASLPFVLILASWHNPETRALVTSIAGGLQLRHVVELGLGDRDLEVAMAGCTALGETGGALSKDLVVQRLWTAHDEELVACLLDKLPGELEGRASMRLQALTARWERELWQEKIGPEQACAVADHLRQAERSGADMASPRLLTCAVGAPEPAARQCCAQSLRGAMGGAPSVAAILPSPARALETVGMIERIEMVIASPVRADPDVRATLGLDEPEYDAWTIRIGCQALKVWRNDVRDQAGRALVQTLSDTCELAPPGESTVGIWNQACTEAEATLNPAQMDDALCGGVVKRFATEAVALARRDVTRAHRIAKEPPETATLFETMMRMGVLPPELGGDDAEPPGATDLERIKALRNSGLFEQFGDTGSLDALMKLMDPGGEAVDPEQLRRLLDGEEKKDDDEK